MSADSEVMATLQGRDLQLSSWHALKAQDDIPARYEQALQVI